MDETKELTIIQLTALMDQRGYHDSVIIGITDHLKDNKLADYVRLRPNGADCVMSLKDDLDTLKEKYKHWNAEWIRILR